jgi:plasmid maintenance system killer protein
MIRSYRGAETRRLMERQASLKFKNVERTALIRMRLLNAATSLGDLRLPPSLGTAQSRQERSIQYPHQ